HDGLAMKGQRAHAINGVGGKGHQAAVAQDIDGIAQHIGIGSPQDLSFHIDRAAAPARPRIGIAQPSANFCRAAAAPSWATLGATQSAAARAAAELLPMATPKPAQASMAASLSLSPTASTASRPMPRYSASQASPVALLSP